MGLSLACILVKYDGDPVEDTFVLCTNDDTFVSELAETIKAKRPDIPAKVVPKSIHLWMPTLPLLTSLHLELPAHVKALNLNDPGNEHGVMPLNKSVPIHQYFPQDHSLPFEHIQVIAQLPPDRKKGKGKGILC